MSQLVGTWVRGDTGRPLVYTVLLDGTALDVSSATSVSLSLVRMASGSDVTLSVSAASVAADGKITFTFGAATFDAPASRTAPDVYEARIKFTLNGGVYYTDAFRIAITKFP